MEVGVDRQHGDGRSGHRLRLVAVGHVSDETVATGLRADIQDPERLDVRGGGQHFARFSVLLVKKK